MKIIEWINGITKLNKTTMDEFQNNIKEEFDSVNSKISSGFPIGSVIEYYLPNCLVVVNIYGVMVLR